MMKEEGRAGCVKQEAGAGRELTRHAIRNTGIIHA